MGRREVHILSFFLPPILIFYLQKTKRLNNKKYFRAAKPDHFFSLLEQEKGSLQEKEENLKKILPKLSLLSGISCKNQRVSVFEGKKGIITILEDVLKCAKENLVFSTPEIQIIKDYLAHFHNKRVKAKIFDKIITNKSDLKRAKALAKLPFTEIKVMDILELYINNDRHTGKAGGFGVQDRDFFLVTEVS